MKQLNPKSSARSCGAAMLASPALAADVTPERLANPDRSRRTG